MNPSNQKTTTNPAIQSFLESLRQRSTANTSEKNIPFSSFESYREQKNLEQQRKQQFFETRNRELNQIYNQKEKREAAKIEQITQELKKLASSIKKLDSEIQKAVNAPITQTGRYQESFLEHLNQIITLMKQQVDNSSTWLHVFNSRQQKRDYFWGHVAKSGTKFMLSEERQIATSIG